MRRSSLWLLILLALILQTTLFTKIGIWGVKPDSSLILIVYVALGLGSLAGSVFGFLLGLAHLSILSASVASVPLAGTVVGFLVGKYGTKIMYESYIVQLLIIFVSVLVFDVINLAWADPWTIARNVVRFSIGSAVYTSVVGVVLVIVIERIIGLRLVS